MDEETKERFEVIEKRLNSLENKYPKPEIFLEDDNYAFNNKKLDHNQLLEELLKSDFCHGQNGLTKEQILITFQKNGRPVVPKKINDLMNKWVERKKIEIIKKYGESRYFWIENG